MPEPREGPRKCHSIVRKGRQVHQTTEATASVRRSRRKRMSASARELVAQSIQVSQSVESPPKPRLLAQNSTWICMPWTEGTGPALSSITRHCQGCFRLAHHVQMARSSCHYHCSQLLSSTPDLSMCPPRYTSRELDGPSRAGLLPQQGQHTRCLCLHLVGTQLLVKCQPASLHRCRLPMPNLTHVHAFAAASMPETPTVDGPTGGDQPQRQKQPRSRFRTDGTRRRTAGEIEKGDPMSNSGKPTRPGKLSNNNQNKQPHLLSRPHHPPPDATQGDRSTSASTQKKIKGSRQTAPGRRHQRPKTTGSPMDGTNMKTTTPGTGDGQIGIHEPPGQQPGKVGLTGLHRGQDKQVRSTGMARSDSPQRRPARGHAARK